jgi:outer membrane receptor protein involved in Fe transport
MHHTGLRTILLGTAISAWTCIAFAEPASAQAVPPPPPAGQDLGLEEIVVTATAKPTKKLETSISVSDLSADQLEQIAPQSTADILRDIPGIRSEASGGEGNANIAVRGLPIASGGGKYVQFQEDGLPVLQFGDIAFGNADGWFKSDYNIENVEVVRGGSASTFASDAPGAVFNFIDKTGLTEGGAVGLTSGLNYFHERLDADYGGPLADGWRFHVGGFYRAGDGIRSIDYLAENGGQIKANLTHELADGGFIRVNVEYLNDRTPAYQPLPIQENAGSSFSAIPGFDPLYGATQTKALQNTLSYDHSGNVISTSLSDGLHVETGAFGAEARFNLADDWQLDDKFRVAINAGDFVGPYPADVGTIASIAAGIGGAGSTVRYATGPNAGQVIVNPGGLNGNGLAVNTVLFNTATPDFNNYSNLLSTDKKFSSDSFGDVTVSAGLFTNIQDLVMDWHWTDYLLEVKGDNPQLLDVYNAKGVRVTQGGLVAYYASAFGCASCSRYYDMQYVTNAPFVDLAWHAGPLNVDGSLRYDVLDASGIYQQAAGTFLANPAGGLLLPAATAASGPIDQVSYNEEKLSYSIGANYELMPDLAIFARGSKGARFNADRALPSQADGEVPSYAGVDTVEQQEAGVKWSEKYFNLFVTGFHATTDEYGTNITNAGLSVYARSYESFGVETEFTAHYGPAALRGGVTYTDAKITADGQLGATDIGEAPQRQAKWVFQATPSYNTEDFSVGANIVGTTSSLASNPGSVIQPGFVTVGLFGQYFVNEQVQLSFNASNIFNSLAITEVDQGSGTPGQQYATARVIPGRAFELGIKYMFGAPSAASEPAAAPAPLPAPPPAAPPAAPVEAARSFQVFFDFDKSNITAAAAKVIQAAADAVRAGHVVQITVTGHTDTVGSAAYNQGLSERRAASVKGQLVADGVASGEITTLGVGKTGLLVPTADGVREPQNRRAEIVLQ